MINSFWMHSRSPLGEEKRQTASAVAWLCRTHDGGWK